MAYGYEVQGRDDRKVDIAREMVQLASEISLPGALLINNLPFCESSPSSCRHSAEGFTLVRYIPEWIPWFSYKPLARYGQDLGDEVRHAPMSFVRESMVRKNLGNRACFKHSLFVRLMALLDHHLPSSVCKRRRNWRVQNAKRQRKWLRQH